MKRFLIIALVAMLVVGLMAVPAFANDSISSYVDEFGNACFPVVPESGRYLYQVAFLVDGLTFTSSGVVDLEYVYYADEETDFEVSTSYGPFIYDDDVYYNEMLLGVVLGPDERYPEGSPILCVVSCNNVNYDVVSLTLKPVAEVVDGDGATDSVLAVFTGIGSWIIAELGNATSLFYQADTGLTLLGVLAVSALGIAVVFLLINWIKRMLQFRR